MLSEPVIIAVMLGLSIGGIATMGLFVAMYCVYATYVRLRDIYVETMYKLDTIANAVNCASCCLGRISNEIAMGADRLTTCMLRTAEERISAKKSRAHSAAMIKLVTFAWSVFSDVMRWYLVSWTEKSAVHAGAGQGQNQASEGDDPFSFTLFQRRDTQERLDATSGPCGPGGYGECEAGYGGNRFAGCATLNGGRPCASLNTPSGTSTPACPTVYPAGNQQRPETSTVNLVRTALNVYNGLDDNVKKHLRSLVFKETGLTDNNNSNDDHAGGNNNDGRASGNDGDHADNKDHPGQEDNNTSKEHAKDDARTAAEAILQSVMDELKGNPESPRTQRRCESSPLTSDATTLSTTSGATSETACQVVSSRSSPGPFRLPSPFRDQC